MKISDEVINDILKSADIVDIIGNYIPVIKKGRAYSAVCPFHDDHDPSLSISKEKQIYKCFVCGDGGNVFTFVMHYKKCSFLESVAEVAKLINKPLDISFNQAKKVSKYQKYYDILNDMISFTNYILSIKVGSEALEYLKKRGIDETMIDYFNIGYNPNKNVIYDYLHSKQYLDKDLIDLNVVRMNDRGYMNDVFYDRILFPIHDQYGNPVAFTARNFTKEDTAKYINTSTTLIYNKGNVVYNYHRAKEDAKRSNRIIVCEGVLDVIAFKRADISNVVCTLGTALTYEQLNLIHTLAPQIILCYDGDKAGKAATLKAIELGLKNNIELSVINNKTGLDPDEIISSGKAKDLKDLANRVITGIEFAFDYLKELYPLNNYSNTKAYHLRMMDLINQLNDPYDRDNHLLTLENITGLTYVNKTKPQKNEVVQNTKRTIKKEDYSGLDLAQFTILNMMSISKNALNIYLDDLNFMIGSNFQSAANLILKEYRQYGECNISRLIDNDISDDIKNIFLEMGLIETIPNEFDEEIYRGAINKVKSSINKYRLDNLKEKILNGENTANNLKEYAKLIREMGGKQNG